MTKFFVGDKVKVALPRGYSKRGVLGISVLYTTSAEAKFDGAVGVVKEINPTGLYSTAAFLVDFRGQDNSRLGIPWQANWFREEWLELVERAVTSPSKSADPLTRAATASAEGSEPVTSIGGPGKVEPSANSARA